MWSVSGFELVSPCLFPMTITITPRAPPPKLLALLYPFHILLVHRTTYAYFISWDMFCILFNTSCMDIMHILNVFICVNEVWRDEILPTIMSTFYMTMLKGDNHLIRVDNFTILSILTRFSASRLSFLMFMRQTCQRRGSKNYSDKVAQRTVNKIIWSRVTCSHLKVEHWYWEKWWLCWEVGMWSTEDILMHDTSSCVGNYYCTKEKGITFWLTVVYK